MKKILAAVLKIFIGLALLGIIFSISLLVEVRIFSTEVYKGTEKPIKSFYILAVLDKSQPIGENNIKILPFFHKVFDFEQFRKSDPNYSFEFPVGEFQFILTNNTEYEGDDERVTIISKKSNDRTKIKLHISDNNYTCTYLYDVRGDDIRPEYFKRIGLGTGIRSFGFTIVIWLISIWVLNRYIFPRIFPRNK